MVNVTFWWEIYQFQLIFCARHLLKTNFFIRFFVIIVVMWMYCCLCFASFNSFSSLIAHFTEYISFSFSLIFLLLLIFKFRFIFGFNRVLRIFPCSYYHYRCRHCYCHFVFIFIFLRWLFFFVCFKVTFGWCIFYRHNLYIVVFISLHSLTHDRLVHLNQRHSIRFENKTKLNNNKTAEHFGCTDAFK